LRPIQDAALSRPVDDRVVAHANPVRFVAQALRAAGTDSAEWSRGIGRRGKWNDIPVLFSRGEGLGRKLHQSSDSPGAAAGMVWSG